MLLKFSGQPLATLRDGKVMDTLADLGLGFDDVTELDVSCCELLSLEGVERFVNLQKLDACNNQITALAPLWGLTKLQVVRLRRNNLHSIWLRRAGSATVIAAKDDTDVPTSGVETAQYTVLDLESNQIDCVRSEPSTTASISTVCLLLANNNIDDFSGLKSFCGMTVIDLSMNVRVDASLFLDMEFSTTAGVRLFLQGCEVTHQESLVQILERDSRAEVVASGGVTIEHPRLTNMGRDLDLDQLREKEFVDFDCEFADFRYKGDALPRELKTPRECGDVEMEASQFVVRTKCPTKQLMTVSTMVDLADATLNMQRTLDSMRQYSTIGNESGAATPMSINTMDEEMNPAERLPSSRSLMSDYTTKDVEMLNSQYMNDIVFTKSKLMPADWQETVKQEFYAQF